MEQFLGAASAPTSAWSWPSDFERRVEQSMAYSREAFQHVNYLWDDAEADKLDPVERLRYRSNLLGSDQRITNTGGGNTSSKVRLPDPLTKQPVDVLWVKGSGGDLRTATRANFASLYMDKLLSLQGIYDQAATKGAKTEIEDRMVDLYRHTTYNLNPAVGSIDSWDRAERPLGGKRYATLDEPAREALLARLLRRLRGLVSQQNRFIGTVHTTAAVLQFVNSHGAPRLAEVGTSCPDHFLRTKIKPLYVDWNPQSESFETLLAKLDQGLAAYRADYAAYYQACKHPDSPAMRD